MKTFLFLALSALLAVAEPAVIISDATWKAGESGEPGWTTGAFDDSAWAPATPLLGPTGNGDHYSVRNVFGYASKAEWIWGPGRACWLRRTFDVTAGFRRVELIYSIDNIGDIYVNGELADRHTITQFGARGAACIVDLLPWVREGSNIIAIYARNISGPYGVAAEIRVDGEPFLDVRSGTQSSLSVEVREAARGFARHFDAQDLGVREAAEGALRSLALRHGFEVTIAARPELESAEAKARLHALQRKLPAKTWAPVVGPDERWAFVKWSPANVEQVLEDSPDDQRALVRLFVAVRSCSDLDPEGIDRVLRNAALGVPDLPAERAVRSMVSANLESQVETLRAVLLKRPASRAGAFAASGLARLGNERDIPALIKAAECGNPVTARAATAAIRILTR